MFKTRFNHGTTPGITFEQPSMTQQCFKDECDINVVLANYTRTGVMEHIAPGKPMFGDFTAVTDFQTAQDQLLKAQEDFATLDSSIRKRFDNDPGKLLSFMADESNYEEAVSLGLIERRAKVDALSPVEIPVEKLEPSA